MQLRFTLAAFLALTASAARADEACALAEQLMQIGALSHSAVSTANAQSAARSIDLMLAQIARIPRGAGHPLADRFGNYDLAEFLDSRTQLAAVLSSQGLAAAQRHAADPSYRANSRAARALGGLLECAGKSETTGANPAGASSAWARLPDTLPQSLGHITGANGLTTSGIEVAKSSLLTLGAMAAVLAIFALLARRRPERRHDLRYLCDIPAQIATGGEILHARIIDISARGAKLMIRHDFEERQSGTITLGQLGETSFRVVWTNQNYAGIQFRARLSFPVADFIQETGVKHE